MADTETDLGSSDGGVTDFPKVEALNASEDDAKENFLPMDGHDVPEGAPEPLDLGDGGAPETA